MVTSGGLKSSDCPRSVLDLIERFELHRDTYKRQTYNEAQVRREFIDPLFKALGWDIDNESGLAEAYKDVIHEDAIKVGGSTKAPDYCFRIGGTRKFFVEAKKPAEDIKQKREHAYQLRRYAWTAKLPISILTDFEEFAVFDCTKRPKPTDKASTGRVLYFTYDQYPDCWSDVWSCFSKDAILKGEFDRFAESARRKHGTAEVDDEFLKEIEQWRDWLARNIALRNGRLNVRELNYAVTKTIDRIIFLRMCEDRGIETDQPLSTLPNGPNIYPRLVELFRRADERYNSGLFHFVPETGRAEAPDELTPKLTVDDKLLKDIIKRLYYPECPYEFSVMPPEILGQVYEQFLGKVITLTAGHRARIEYKPEVKKAGGVYYTPKYIVDFIVEHTVGKLLEGKTPAKVGPMLDRRQSRGRKRPPRALCILDPACGSGSFLLGAYRYLLDWHLRWYTDDDPKTWARKKHPPIYQSPKPDPTAKGPTWRLTVGEKKRILLNNIHGVDIDPQAVEVTKLSLLLKVLEGESQQTLENQLRLFHERALPDLGNNIKCGNSLIGPDFYEDRQLDLLDDEERYRINVFDWDSEFPDIMQSDGFHAIIGNPPWGAYFSDAELAYHRRRNKQIIVRMIDSFMYFLYQSSQRVRTRGIVGMIVPDVLLYQVDNRRLREHILSNFAISRVVSLGNVFQRVTRPCAVIVFENIAAREHPMCVLDISEDSTETKPQSLASGEYSAITSDVIRSIPQIVFPTSHPERYTVSRRISESQAVPLSSCLDGHGIQRGVSPDLKAAFLVSSAIVAERKLEAEFLRPVVTGGRHVKRYRIDRPGLFVIYTTRDDDFSRCPNICDYIATFRPQITCREVREGKHPLFALHRPRNPAIFGKPTKAVGVITEDELVVAIDESQVCATDGLYVFGCNDAWDIRFVVGLLNSRLLTFLYRLFASEAGRVLAQVKPAILETLPIPVAAHANTNSEGRSARVTELVERMASLHRQLEGAKTPTDKTAIQRQIDATDRQIDQLVYELYDLTDEEIHIVEEATTGG